MKLYQILLLPISIIYGIVISFRNLFFDLGIFSSKSFKVPVIVVGNLSTGGTGKTPHIEYLIKLLKQKFSVAVLSRGYGRKSTGFVLSTEDSTAAEIGDEPLQIKRKNPNITVAVCASRVIGIKKILSEKNAPEVILLDDAFQHRYVKPSLNILLTDYSQLYTNDFVLPSGNLRELAKGAKRADVIIVTKTPAIFSPIDKRYLLMQLKPKKHQKVFFSYTSYSKNLFSVVTGKPLPFELDYYFEKNAILLLTGIANSSGMEFYIKNQAANFRHIAYADHHRYTLKDLQQIKSLFNSIAANNKLIITTEKDAMRLSEPELKNQLGELPIYYLPIEVKFHGHDTEEFNHYILNHVRES
jgi:tetraacyldisaccharide 4'-kinase